LREHHAGCRLSSALLQAQQNESPNAVCSRNLSKFTLAHDAVAAAVLHKHHLIIRVGAGLIQFVYQSHSRLPTEFTRHRKAFLPFLARVFRKNLSIVLWYIHTFSSTEKSRSVSFPRWVFLKISGKLLVRTKNPKIDINLLIRKI